MQNTAVNIKIDNETIIAIHKDIEAGLTLKELIEKYGVSKSTIYRIKNKIGRYGKAIEEYVEEDLTLLEDEGFDDEEEDEDEYFEEEDSEKDEVMVLNYYKVKIKKFFKIKKLKTIYNLETEEDVRKIEDYINDSILDLKRELEKDGFVDMIIPTTNKKDLILYIVTDNDIKLNDIKLALDKQSEFSKFKCKTKEIDADKFDKIMIDIT